MRMGLARCALLLSLLPLSGWRTAADALTPTQIAQRLEPLQRYCWHGWKPGTEVRKAFLGDKRQGFHSYVQGDLHYRIGAEGKTVVVTQVVGGKPREQTFPERPLEDGTLPKASMYLGKGREGQPTQLEIGESVIDCLLFQDTLHTFTAAGCHTTVFKEWVLPTHPWVWLRRETNDNYSVVKSLRETRRVGGREFPCVIIEERMKLAGGHSLTTRCLSSEIPGHFVEETQEIHTSLTLLPTLIHSIVAEVKVAE